MMGFLKKTFLFFPLACVLLSNAGFALALEVTNYPTIFGKTINSSSTLPDFVCYFFGLGMNLAFFIAVAVIAFGGVYYLVSYGRGKFTSEAKDWIKAGITGLLIAVCAALISSTINPQLNTCKLGILSLIPLTPGNNNPNSLSNANITTYKEVPIGILTENLLTMEEYCYLYDKKGDPLPRSSTSDKPDWEPKKDIGNCLTEQFDGAQKKGQVLAVLADEIIKLMNKCDCKKYGQCGTTCGNTQPAGIGTPCSALAPCTLGMTCGSSGKCEDNTGCDQPEPGLCPLDFPGNRHNGDACTADIDCAYGLTCVEKTVKTCVGTNTPCSGPGDCGGVACQTKIVKTCDGRNSIAAPCYADENCQGGFKCDTNTNKCVPFGTCTGKCAGSGCAQATPQPPGPPDCCPPIAYENDGVTPIKDASGNTISVKEQIEHGPIKIGFDINGVVTDCLTDPTQDCCINKEKPEELIYKGLDEFRCPDEIVGETQGCTKNMLKYATDSVDINGEAGLVVNQEKWKKLSIVAQLEFIKEIISSFGGRLQKKINELDNARAELNNGKCYLVTPYVDLGKAYEGTDKKDRVILTQPFTDPDTGKKVDSSKYCTGFNYANSICLKKGNDMCPDTASSFVTGCTDPASCLTAYNARKCTNSEKKSDQSFGDYVTECRTHCSENCKLKYGLACSYSFQFCESQCEKDSACILGNSVTGVPANADKCLFTNKGTTDCASKLEPNDTGNTEYCVDHSYLCENGSNEYGGYPDCAEPSNIKCTDYVDKQSCKTQTVCNWEGGGICENDSNCLVGEKCDLTGLAPGMHGTCGKCVQNYTASFFYDNKNAQKCPDPYKPADGGKACSGGTSCQKTCPETTKCPMSSKCSTCPCDQIEETLKFSVPDDYDPSKTDQTYTQNSQLVSAHQMVGPKCNSYAYNDDPLTFYCETSYCDSNGKCGGWYTDPQREGSSQTPVGMERVIELGLEGEIPVGQTVDDAKLWAATIIKRAAAVTDNLQQMLDQAKKAGKAKDDPIVKDYCKCDAKYEYDAPICKTECESTTTYHPVGDPTCACVFIPCKGNPCTQIKEYVSKIWDYYKKLKLYFIDYKIYMLKEPRSDIMKKLTYSRQTVNNCSVINNTHDLGTRLLSCTRVEDELISPVNTSKLTKNQLAILLHTTPAQINAGTVNGYCYGRDLGSLFGYPAKDKKKSLTDNWFCAQQYSKKPGSSGAGNGGGGGGGF